MRDTNDKIHKRSIKKIDAIVTSMLLGGIIASIYGIKKTAEHLDEKAKTKEDPKKSENQFKKILKLLIFGNVEPIAKKKEGLFSRLFKK